MSKPRSTHVFTSVVVLVIASLACGCTTTEKRQEAVEEIQVISQGFGQDGQELGFAFLIDNPNATLAFEGSQYQVAVYNDADTMLDTDSGFIDLILPSQTLGIAGNMSLDEGATVSKLEVQLLIGDPVSPEPFSTFTVESITYYANEFYDVVTGVINSSYNIDLRNIDVSAIVYNESGEIVGGGFSFINFILANGSTGVEVYVTTSGDGTTVELYPTVSGLTYMLEEPELPEGASNLALIKQGFGQDDWEVGFGILLENPNGSFAIDFSQYHVTAFAGDGRVLATDYGYVDVLLPNQTLGVAGTIYIPDDTEVAQIDTQIQEGVLVESDPFPYFTAENVTYQPNEYFPQVTGQIVSTYNKDIADVRVSAILYNEAGEIIGGGFTYLDLVPANGKAAVELYVTSSGAPVATDLYAAVGDLSEFE